jgi:hypothetical protein
MHDPIAERNLSYRAAGSDLDEPVVVRMGRSLPSSTHAPLFEVEFEIDGPGDHQYSSKVYGTDGMQAVGLALSLRNGLIDAVRRDGSVKWDGSEMAARLPT